MRYTIGGMMDKLAALGRTYGFSATQGLIACLGSDLSITRATLGSFCVERLKQSKVLRQAQNPLRLPNKGGAEAWVW